MKKYLFIGVLAFFVGNVFANDLENLQSLDEEEDVVLGELKPISDPLESINRKVYSFNKGVDSAIIKPVTVGYKDYVPGIVQKGFTNLLNYIKGPVNVINYTLQGNGLKAGDAMGRLIVNTFGFGVLDFASEAQIPLENTTFGDTLGVWGVGEGPYVVLPILGGGTLRDNTAKIAVDIPGSVEAQFPLTEMNTVLVIKSLDTRKEMLSMDKTIEEAALDEYSFVKSAIVSHKRSIIKELKGND